ncbi:MAG: hypothetical protein GXO97_07520 [Nitrospirae bacterium]|nr:hypothetical protein [Nitrospirota bacterium]
MKAREILVKLKESVSGIREALIITEDGFPVVSTLEAGETEVRYTAGGAIICDAGQRGVRELDLGLLEAVVTVGSEGYFVLSPVSDGMFLMIIASHNVALGMVLLKLKKSLPLLKSIFIERQGLK